MVVAGTSALIDGSGFEVVGVTAASARRMAQACRRWGAHPAALDFGDCLAYGPTSPQVLSALYRRGFPEDGRMGGPADR